MDFVLIDSYLSNICFGVPFYNVEALNEQLKQKDYNIWSKIFQINRKIHENFNRGLV